MPLLNTITTPYAEAFLQVASSRNEVDQVIDQAKAILSLWNECPALSEAMGSPVLEVDAKKNAIEKLFADQVTPSFLNFLKLFLPMKIHLNVIHLKVSPILHFYFLLYL